MKLKFKLAVVAGTLAGALAPPAFAQHLTAQERARLESQVAAQRSITADLDARARALNRAYIGARGIDKVIGTAVGEVPGGKAAYTAGKVVGGVGYRVVERGRR